MELTKAHYQTLIETSSDAIVLLNDLGEVMYQTPSAERTIGYSLEEMQQLDGLDQIHPDDRVDDRESFFEFAKTPGAILHKKHRFRHKNGHYIWIEGTYRNLLHDEHLKVIVYCYRDVTARVQSELKLRERIKELSTIYEVTNILQDDYLDMDVVFARIVNLLPAGWQYPDICAARIIFDGKEYCTPNYAPSSYKQCAPIKTSDGRTGMIQVVYNRKKNNAIKPPFLQEQRELISTVATAIEGYLNKKANQEALAKSGANLKSIFNTTQVAYLLLDNDYNVMEYNQYYREYYALLTGNVIETGKNYFDIVLAERYDLLKKKIEDIRANRSPVKFETFFINNDITTYFDVTISPVLNSGSIIGFCISAQDITDKKNTEIDLQEMSDRLQENVNLLKIFVECSPAAIAMFDTDMNYIQGSKRWVCDYSTDGIYLPGKDRYDILPCAPRNWKNIIQRCLAGSVEKNDEDSFVREDGTREWTRWEIQPWTKASGEIGGVIMFTEVITEKIETQLKFRNLVEKSPVGVYILQNGKFVYVNPSIIDESGYTEEELTGMPVDKFVFEDDLETMYKNIEARLSGVQESVRYDLRTTKKDGSILWVEMFGTSTLYNGAPALIGTMVNMTEQKAIYNELKKSEANLRSIFDTTHVSYLLLDEHFTILAYNQYLTKWYKAQTGIELHIGGNVIELAAPDKREAIRRALTTVVTTCTAVEYETEYRNGDTVMYFTVTVTPVISNGKAIGACMVDHDITKRKNVELERQKVITDLVQRNRDLEQFSYIVSHNVRGPLSTIMGLNNMLTGIPIEEDREFIHDGIKECSEKLDCVIKDLNEILQVRRELSELKVRVDFQSVVNSVKGSIMLLIKEKKVTIICNFAAVSELLIVKSYINSIFYNLITNSIKFAHPDRPPVIEIWTEREKGKVNIHFRDNGIGIDLNRYHQQVFSLYKRFHPAVEGKGLGLFMTKTQVEVLNGTIEVHSKPGEGTSFKITFNENAMYN